MTDVQQRAAARQFAADWEDRGDEKQETQAFWLALLQKVFGVEEPEKYISFERRVEVDDPRTGKRTTKFIDGYIPQTRVLVEQKGRDIVLTRGYKQSDGSLLSPYQQARRYGAYLPQSEQPRWIVVCNFQTFEVHDMNFPNGEPEVLTLADLAADCSKLNFLVNTGSDAIKHEEKVSLQAGELVGVLYDALLQQYKDPTDPKTLKSLNALCVRLVFCLYAEDAGIFNHRRDMFHDYLRDIPAHGIRKALVELFRTLDQKPQDRDKYLFDDNPTLAAFPYVNGGLFADEDIEIPPFTEELKSLLLSKASQDFDWSAISPTIFGAVFESTLNPDTRRSGGMHYTSIENIHKVIDPLFLNGLKAELEEIKRIPVERTRETRLAAYQDKLASLTFLDPACGSGNFLTESYISLRRLENQVIEERIILDKGRHGYQVAGQVAWGEGALNPVQVSIHQFYGIEINDFAATVAKTALWIAESQMLKETEDIVAHQIDFLPLKSYANITEGNALRLNWEDVVPKEKLNYIMGNPPFVGYSLQSKEQKEDILSIYVDEKGKPYKTAGKIDYVSGWYFKASQYMQDTPIRTAFVSTNSITQGEQVAGVWKPLYDRFGIHIDFAHRTFRWDSEASLKAHVHCVIVGFSVAPFTEKKWLFTSERVQEAENINAYLMDAPNVFIGSRNKPLCNVPLMTTGNRPADGGHLIIEDADYADFIKEEPSAKPYIKQLIGAAEFINNKKRWCLWLVGVSPAELRKMPLVMKRVEACKADRENAPDAGRRKLADCPTQFREINNPDTFIVVPAVSSERRKYVPIGFLDKETIATNLVITIPDATLYHFGILTSNVHMAWMRAVCGRLEMRYRYSKDVVYNNFPWPTPTDEQKSRIEQTAQAILDARELYPDCSLADLYDEATMPPELRKAHQQNDKAVMQAYGFWGKLNSESACVAELMRMYQLLSER
ncbi:class I SAM-dependent DNA methyltransferase [Flintibacter faecis]|uniref:site-specific DNA-methyltransferase (adenine-specific) n=1 Tax=Flintibacter faecis TaxID=2763047 RepID=A0A8J6J2F2_9FIRM|nr:class I SAM-dependent DNA methyltransferase [Flintibacter faecis]MBC5715976.1 class I SAM-dependent DNA methyltransferase [Flintibacter faecis]